MFLEGEYDTIGNDGEEHGILEWWPLNDEPCEPADCILFREDEE